MPFGEDRQDAGRGPWQLVEQDVAFDGPCPGSPERFGDTHADPAETARPRDQLSQASTDTLHDAGAFLPRCPQGVHRGHRRGDEEHPFPYPPRFYRLELEADWPAGAKGSANSKTLCPWW